MKGGQEQVFAVRCLTCFPPLAVVSAQPLQRNVVVEAKVYILERAQGQGAVFEDASLF